ncbi:MAG: cyclic nucleotide-binding domain-containing protein [Alphaproteobacteria bacterium]|nr:cyclic nucleotide-binding domain-containing protein [Alphaproteobacteria bacterium]
MSILSEVELLRRVPLFANIDTSRLKLLAFTSERLSFDAGAVLFREGDRGDSAYLILTGKVDVAVNSPKGEVVVAHLGANNIVGEMALLCEMPRTATIIAAEPLDTLRIKKDQFLQMLRDIPQMPLEIMRELAVRLNNVNKELSAAHVKLRAAGLE